MTRIKNTDQAPEDLVERTRDGLHEGWSFFDEKFEGARYQLMHELVSADIFDKETAAVVLSELEDYAQSYGYASADSALHKFGHLSDDELENEENTTAKIIMNDLFDNDGDDDPYFSELLKSEAILRDAAKTQESLNFLGMKHSNDGYKNIYLTVKNAFVRGRDMKKEEYDKPSGPKP
jgi:hypothetical protein